MAVRPMEGPFKMNPRFWMITNRQRDVEDLNGDRGPLTYWVAEGGAPTILSLWNKVGAIVSWALQSSQASRRNSPM
jgi:hypothetical protein